MERELDVVIRRLSDINVELLLPRIDDPRATTVLAALTELAARVGLTWADYRIRVFDDDVARADLVVITGVGLADTFRLGRRDFFEPEPAGV